MLYTSRSPSLIYQMPQLFSNSTRNFWMFFTFIVEGKKAFVFHYIFPPTPSLFLRFLKLSQHARTRVTLSLGADFSYKLPEQLGVQATLLFYQLPPGPDPSAVPGLSWFLLSAPHTVLYMDINRGLSESEPCLE